MIHFDLPKQKSSIIKVLGVGGGGSNAVNFMFEQDIEGVDFIICNTDAKAIEQSKIPNKIQLGPHLTQGLGAGANPEVGKKATEESLDEIRRILEVNTKMAFITVGMGGGTGTGGAPIIAQICKELDILTVGIVTTPFGFEGPRRQLQAEEGIRQLKPYVDTLLVISNDKLRMQYGNLKMKEAFSKADNVLATAAKCITDVINSRGHIIVDFADVCTVMKNGGVAILGKAEVEGENRAQLAIEEALASPLLNDNDIKGAKWILININSAEGDHECTMDELETINNHLRMQAGEDTDVIVGMGYDNSLDQKIGITLIATGFEHKDPFAKPVQQKKVEPQPEKIVMTLDVNPTPATPKAQEPVQQTLPLVEEKDPMAPSMEEVVVEEPVLNLFSQPQVQDLMPEVEETPAENYTLQFELSTEITQEVKVPEVPQPEVHVPVSPVQQDAMLQFKLNEESKPQPQAPVSGLFNKPQNIYAEPDRSAMQQPMRMEVREEPKETTPATPEMPDMSMQLVEKEEKPQPRMSNPSFADDQMMDDVEEQKKRAAERIQKLRNLSFNISNGGDVNNEFDNVPAYVRRNMELFGNTLTSVEDFYSKYTVGKDENDQTNISSLNTFLEGKKPD
jgi:cell division protein FtsZ